MSLNWWVYRRVAILFFRRGGGAEQQGGGAWETTVAVVSRGRAGGGPWVHVGSYSELYDVLHMCYTCVIHVLYMISWDTPERLKVCSCTCRRGEARPRGLHLLQRPGWKSCSDGRRLEHHNRLLRRHSDRKFIRHDVTQLTEPRGLFTTSTANKLIWRSFLKSIKCTKSTSAAP